ncbi:TnsA endonuclease N-terminal domain-containing protein [Rhodoferax ferrireducens]|uniref:TnsA endonuclease N-terminal domain-containing protein n=1 Tax=Rhodoferax ferrireducens TaxID=192843 RepID=UPI00298DEDB2|nr:TnsA endonuclease N-terminal domain-containing protein [Rhodoferax ferrireducens]WPC66698.1 TnsA endonuclease N-terminal domain-containing protein [Rhodoferax ferrireducens]
MAVRKIPKNYLFVTGGYSSRKNEEMDAFESLLEKDYLLTLDFDDAVAKFEVQPARIPVPGFPKGYVPDVFVEYRPDPQTGEIRKPSLVEVKSAEDLVRNTEKHAPKFAAARQYAEERDWEFRTVDQNEIRSPRLANLKFLREYRNFSPSSDDICEFFQLVVGADIKLTIAPDIANAQHGIRGDSLEELGFSKLFPVPATLIHLTNF